MGMRQSKSEESIRSAIIKCHVNSYFIARARPVDAQWSVKKLFKYNLWVARKACREKLLIKNVCFTINSCGFTRSRLMLTQPNISSSKNGFSRFPAEFCPTTRYYRPNTFASTTTFNSVKDSVKLLPVVCQGNWTKALPLPPSIFQFKQLHLLTRNPVHWLGPWVRPCQPGTQSTWRKSRGWGD